MDTDLTDLTAIRLTTAELVAGLRTMAVGPMPSPMGQMLTAAADRIEALERALVIARTALDRVNGLPDYRKRDGAACCCVWCALHRDSEQALTEIAEVGITGAETAGVQP